MKRSDFHQDICDALDERGVSDERLASMTPRDVLDEVLNWEGISGYTGLIIRTLLCAGATIPGSQ